MNELVKVDPKQYGLDENKANEITKGLTTIIKERDVLTKSYQDLIETEITLKSIPVFRELRLQISKNRTQGLNFWHKQNKAYFLAGGNFVQAIYNKEVAENERMESKLKDAEEYFERLEAERIEKLETERKAEVSKYSEVYPSGLGSMDESVFNSYLTGLKVAYEARIKAEQEAEAERLRLIEVEKENARLKAIEDEKIRKENARLKAEAEAKEKALLAERAKIEAERKAEAEKQAAILAKEREEAERKLKAQQEQSRKDAEKLAAERAKIEAELQAKNDAEIAAQMAKELEETRRFEAERKAAKAPRKEKLTKWVDSFEIAKFENDLLAMEIEAKFQSFKNWAKQQISNI